MSARRHHIGQDTVHSRAENDAEFHQMDERVFSQALAAQARFTAFEWHAQLSERFNVFIECCVSDAGAETEFVQNPERLSMAQF